MQSPKSGPEVDQKWTRSGPEVDRSTFWRLHVKFFRFFWIFCLNLLTRVVDSTMFPHVSRMEQFRSRQKNREQGE